LVNIDLSKTIDLVIICYNKNQLRYI